MPFLPLNARKATKYLTYRAIYATPEEAQKVYESKSFLLTYKIKRYLYADALKQDEQPTSVTCTFYLYKVTSGWPQPSWVYKVDPNQVFEQQTESMDTNFFSYTNTPSFSAPLNKSIPAIISTNRIVTVEQVATVFKRQTGHAVAVVELLQNGVHVGKFCAISDYQLITMTKISS